MKVKFHHTVQNTTYYGNHHGSAVRVGSVQWKLQFALHLVPHRTHCYWIHRMLLFCFLLVNVYCVEWFMDIIAMPC